MDITINPQPEGIPPEERAEEQVGIDARGRRWQRRACDPNMFMLQLLLTANTIFTAYLAGQQERPAILALPISLGLVNFIFSELRARG